MELLVLDTKTIIALLFLGNLLTPLALAAYRGEARKERHYRLFMLGKAFQALAWALMGARGYLPDLISANLGNSFLFCGYALEAAALAGAGSEERLREKAYAAAAAASIVLFWALASTPGRRVGAASAGLVAIIGLGAIGLFRSAKGSRLKLALGFVYLAIAGIFLARSVAGFTSPELSLLTNNALQNLTFTLLFAMLLLGDLAFLLLTKERSDELLAKSEEKYRSLVETTGESIVILQDWKVVYANPASAALFGLPMETLVGALLGDIVSPLDREETNRRYEAQLAGDAGVDRRDIRIRTGDGADAWVLISTNRVKFKGGPAVLAVLTDIAERKGYEERNRQLVRQLEAERNRAELIAVTDGLTKLANRRFFDERLMAEFFRLRRSGAPLSLIMLDVDRFKIYNDVNGHPAGDECLKRVARAMADEVRRPADCAARYGGEEFAVILPETDRTGARGLAERIRQTVECLAGPHPAGGAVTVSLGTVTCLPSLMAAPERVVELADQALYRAKEAGRNRVETTIPDIDEADLAAGVARLAWRASDDSGHPVIDMQHRELQEEANKILCAVMERRGKEELSSLLEALLRGIESHFREEESIIAALYPEAERHRLIHADLLERARTKVADYHAGRIGIGALFGFIAYEVVLDHMHTEDKGFFPYLNAS